MGEKLGGNNDAGKCGNIFNVKVSPDISNDVVVIGSVNEKSTGSMDSNKLTKLLNDVSNSTSGNLKVEINGKEYLVIEDLSIIATEIYKPEILNTEISLVSSKYGSPTLKKLRRKYIKENVGDSFLKVYGERAPIMMVGVAKITIYGFTLRSVGVMKVKIDLDLDVYNRHGEAEVWNVLLSGNLAAANKSRGLSIGVTEFYTSFNGPAIRRIEEVSLAFEGALLETCSLTVQYGAGISAGFLSIGSYVSGEDIVATSGIGNSFGCLAGKVSL